MSAAPHLSADPQLWIDAHRGMAQFDAHLAQLLGPGDRAALALLVGIMHWRLADLIADLAGLP